MTRSRTESFAVRYGKWAIVAGASEGLGAAFAACLAERGMHLLLIARRAELLGRVAGRLREQHGVETRCLALDLADPRLALAEIPRSRALAHRPGNLLSGAHRPPTTSAAAALECEVACATRGAMEIGDWKSAGSVAPYLGGRAVRSLARMRTKDATARETDNGARTREHEAGAS